MCFLSVKLFFTGQAKDLSAICRNVGVDGHLQTEVLGMMDEKKKKKGRQEQEEQVYHHPGMTCEATINTT